MSKNEKVREGERLHFADILTANAKIVKVDDKTEGTADFDYDVSKKGAKTLQMQ